MEKISVLGVDPSLRNTGLAIVEYDVEKDVFFQPRECLVLSNPQKYTGTNAILNMLDMIKNISEDDAYKNVNNVIIESPSIMFNKSWCGGAISSIAHISGGAVALLGIEKSYLFRPNEWNHCRKKDATHNNTISVLGDPEKWHYHRILKSEAKMEHILDAASLALWWIKNNFVYESDPQNKI